MKMITPAISNSGIGTPAIWIISYNIVEGEIG